MEIVGCEVSEAGGQRSRKPIGFRLWVVHTVLNTLLEEKTLDQRYHDHALTGNYIGFRECHILPDWLLIYAVNKSQLILTASRTGTHSDLFGR